MSEQTNSVINNDVMADSEQQFSPTSAGGISVSETKSASKTSATPAQKMDNVNLNDVEIKDENTALNVLVGFLGVAQRRGTFAFNESAKIYECVKIFQPKA